MQSEYLDAVGKSTETCLLLPSVRCPGNDTSISWLDSHTTLAITVPFTTSVWSADGIEMCILSCEARNAVWKSGAQMERSYENWLDESGTQDSKSNPCLSAVFPLAQAKASKEPVLSIIHRVASLQASLAGNSYLDEILSLLCPGSNPRKAYIRS